MYTVAVIGSDSDTLVNVTLSIDTESVIGNDSATETVAP
jgi:hypothetical protein